MSSIDSITITSVSTVNQIEITSTSGITVTTVGTQGLAGPSAIMQKGVDSTTIGSSGNGTFLVYDHANSQWTSSGSASVSNLTVEIQKLRLGGTGATVVSILDEDNMASNSATALATQQSIKAYVESRVGIDNLAALLASGNTTGGTNIVVSANDDITFTDSSKALFGNSSDLQIYHDGTNSYITNSQGALKIATESSGITVNIGHTTSTVAIGDDLTVAGNQNITGTLGVTGTITGSLTGNVTGQVSDISNFTTANITENTNLYYTNERVDDQVNSLLIGGTGITLTYDDNAGTLTIDGQIGDITSVVAGDGLSGGGSSGDVTLTVNVDNSSVEINSDILRVKALGITNDMLAGSITNSKLANADFTINSNSLVLGNSLTLDTDDIGEGSNNQYYTTSRANSDFDTRLATKTTDNLTEGSSRLYFTTARANTSIDNRVTKAFVDNLGVEASSVTANSVALGTDTTGNYIQTVSGTANKITVTGSGSESADITLTLPDDVQIADSLTVAGNLTVNGTLVSLNSTNLDIQDNLFQLNAGLTGSPVNDTGMLINRGNQDNGIFMWDESVDKFTMGLTTADGSATGNITLNSLGTLVVNVEGNLTGSVTGNSSTATTLQTPRSIALSGDVSASAVNFDGSGNITLTTTIEANSIALGTDTVGNYVASITGGTGVTITGGTGESSTPSVAIGQAVGTTDDVTFNQVTADIIGNIEGATEFSASAGEALSKGDAVYISGVSGNKPVVSKADSDDANKMPSFGLVKADANLNANVSVVTFGTLAGLNTSSFSVGDTLYISTTAGVLTATAPTGESSLIQNIGKVQRSHASSGSIKVGGAGRTNATPNLNDGKIFLGNGSNQSVSTTLDSSVVPENTNLYYTDARFDTRLATKDTGDISEGSNLYWTVSRVQAVSINNVVEDTTPQLGGNLDLNSSDITGTGDINITGTATMDGLTVGTTSDAYSQVLINSSTTGESELRMGDTDTDAGSIAYTNSNDTMTFRAAGARMSLNSTGIDVTGTATINGLTVDGAATIDGGATDNTVLTLDSSTANTYLKITDSNSTNGAFIGATTNDLNFYPNNTLSAKFASGGDISFYEDTGTTAKFFWDASAERLGIGTNSPNQKLNVSGGRSYFGANNEAYAIGVGYNGTRTAANQTYFIGATDATAPDLQFSNADGGEKVRITHAGNVGINATSIAANGLQIGNTSSTDTEQLYLYSNKAIFSLEVDGANNAAGTIMTYSWANGGQGSLRFKNASGDVARFDSSGNLLVSKISSDTLGTAGHELHNSGMAHHTRATGTVLYLNRTGDDGNIIDLRKDNTAVGSIGVEGGNNLFIGSTALNHSGLNFTANAISPMLQGSLTDATVALGTPSRRFTDLHLSGTANTSGLSVDGGTIKLDGNYPTGVENVALGDTALDSVEGGGQWNTAIGAKALTATTTGDANTGVGRVVLEANTTGGNNTALGYGSLNANTTASNNTAVGYLALLSNTTGANNVAVGSLALDANTTASKNTAIGQASLTFNTTGASNTAVGQGSLQNNSTASNNTAVGTDALNANTTGDRNVALGSLALDANTTADGNTAVGYSALSANTTSELSTGVGFHALRLNTGANNTAVGGLALDQNTTASGNTAVGYASLGANTTGTENTAVGALALDACTTGDRNTAVGYIALSSITGANDNTAIGREALRDNTANDNTAVGKEALKLNTSGGNNTAVGKHALNVNTTGESNVAVGSQCLDANTTGLNNTAVGRQALDNNTTGSQNVAVGTNTLDANTTADSNTAVGTSALRNNTTGTLNTAVGKDALNANITGSNNVSIGYIALEANTTGGKNVAIGGGALNRNTTASDNTAVGDSALADNTTGTANSSLGKRALKSNTTANNNVAVGYHALEENTTGAQNTAIGSSCLEAQTTAGSNVGVGYAAGSSVTTGGANVVIGAFAGDKLTTGSGNTLVGYNSGTYQTPELTTTIANTMFGAYNTGTSATANDQHGFGYNLDCAANFTTLGAGSTDSRLAFGGTSWAAVSDIRVKKDIKDAEAGLSFINDLRPVTFNYKTKGEIPDNFKDYEEGSTEAYKNEKTQHGFIAQEVKEVIDNHDEITDGFKMWHILDHTGQQEIAEGYLIPILTKAIQELSTTVDELKAEIQTLKGE